MMPSDPEYQNNAILDRLQRLIDSYDRWAHTTFQWAILGTRTIANIESYAISSIQGTLSSIPQIVPDGGVDHAYALLRQ